MIRRRQNFSVFFDDHGLLDEKVRGISPRRLDVFFEEFGDFLFIVVRGIVDV